MTFSEIRHLLNNKHLTVRNLLIFLGLIAFILAITFGYIFYSKNYNQKALEMFSESVVEYNKALNSNLQQDFENAERAFATSYKAYSNSSVSPFMLAYQADASLRSGKHEQAISLMQKSVDSLDLNSPVYYFYATKLALIKLDSKDENIKAQGKSLLENYSKTFSNPYKDMASYYLGYQSWASGDLDSAKKYWQQLAQAGQDSIWAALAGSKLELIN